VPPDLLVTLPETLEEPARARVPVLVMVRFPLTINAPKPWMVPLVVECLGEIECASAEVDDAGVGASASGDKERLFEFTFRTPPLLLVRVPKICPAPVICRSWRRSHSILRWRSCH